MDDIDPDLNCAELINAINSNYYSVEEFQTLMNTSDKMFNIINYNIRSFYQNSDSFLSLFCNNLPQVFILTESWFSPEYTADIPNFKAFHVTRQNRRSGGVSVFVHESLESKSYPQFSYVGDNIEICTVEVKLPTDSIYLLSIYRPHSGTIEAFTVELENILSNLMFQNKRCYIAGDLNLDIGIVSPCSSHFILFNA